MSDETEENASTRRAQKPTCACCHLGHKNEAELKIHLQGMADRVGAQLSRLEPKVAA